MKKLLLLLIMVTSCSDTFNKESIIEGSWIGDNIVYKFLENNIYYMYDASKFYTVSGFYKIQNNKIIIDKDTIIIINSNTLQLDNLNLHKINSILP